MLVAMILMAALLAGATVLVSLQMGANRNTELTKTGITALYCAEAGLTAARAAVAANHADWGTYLGTGTEPTWLATGIANDVDGDGAGPDFKIRLEDNFDETGTDVPTADSDDLIFIVSTCLLYPDTPREVRELVDYTTVSNCYSAQRGGCGGNGNMNSAP